MVRIVDTGFGVGAVAGVARQLDRNNARDIGLPREDWAEARFLLPEDDLDVLAERLARGRAPQGDLRDALAAARLRRDRRPTSFSAALDVVEVELAMGGGVAAARDARAFPERFPTRRAEFRAVVPRIREAGGDPAPRTLAAITAGSP